MKKLLLLVCVLNPVIAEAQRLPANVCATLTEARKTIQQPATPVSCSSTPNHPFCAQVGAALNATAWAHRDEGWGVSKKLTGNRCKSPVGDISCDVLMKVDGAYWDVFGAVGEKTTVNCGNRSGTITSDARKWLTPKDPGGLIPPPPPPPPPTPTCPEDPQVAQLRLELSTARAALTNMTADRDAKYKQLQEWDARLVASEKAQVELQQKLDNVRCTALFRLPCTIIK